MASQDARLSKFEADFKRQQGEMTNKIDTVLKAITDQIAGTLPSDTVKNPKLGTHPVSSARSYPTMNRQCSSHPSTSINAIKAHFKEAPISQTSLQQPVNQILPRWDCERREVHIGKLKLLNDFYVIDMKNEPETPLLEGRGFLATANAVIDCRTAKIAVGERITRSVFGVKGVDLGDEEKN
ncbi:hypothetical protein Tco_1046021 [Tanacetum coccineum]